MLGDTLVEGVERGYDGGQESPFPRTARCLMRRRPVSKGKSARKFRGQAGRTKKLNLAKPGRGGFRI